MNIRRLHLVNMRAFEQAEFDFTPGMNLLVGVNGVGKTTVLDALRICLSKILPAVTASRGRPISFEATDIRGSTSALTARILFELKNRDLEFLVHKQRERSVSHKAGVVRQQTLDTPDKETCTPALSLIGDALKRANNQNLGIYFSTRRSLVSDAMPSKDRSGGARVAAHAESLASRELRLAEFAFWMRAQEDLAAEDPRTKKHLAALRRAAKGFLPGCRNLRAETSPVPRLLVDKEALPLDVRQLSDGERGLFALVLDLARRLSQANPDLSDPLKQGRAVVLIDELDLHLHPKWQRTIVERLTRVFPRCQFIATTHSPQVVAAVEPDQVLLLTAVGVFRPDRTLGMDSNWILRHLMEADDRPPSATEAIQSVEKLIGNGTFNKARTAISKAKKNGLDLPEWSILEARMARLEVLAQ